ncbi:MAG: hypothetical protein K0V04_30510, partial [Deltaproteobacteria bacterium]|nr:hypothetical protein [Deltaproteobacteria bacterium]
MTFATWIFDTTRTPQRRRAIDGVLMLATVSVGCVDDTVPSVDGSTASTTSTGAATTTGPTPTSTTDGLDSTLGGPPSTTTTTDDPSTSTTRGSTDTGTSSGTSSTDTGTSSGSGTTTGSGSSESTAGLPPAPCLTVSCDGICCPAGDECINDSCVPICVSEVRCGPNLLTCCPEADVCLDDVCVTPGASCNDSYDCAVAQFCEPTLDQCLPQPQPNACEFVPSFVDVDPLLQWSWEEDEIETIPVVGDIDGDGLPEVIFSTRSATDPNGASLVFFGEIVVLDGTTGLEQFRVQQDPNAGSFGSYSRTTPGIADVDGNGLADIVYAGRPEIFIPPFANNSSRIHAVNGLGQHLWSSHAPDGSPYYIFVRNGAPVFANLDADDASEIIFGTAVIDDDGTVVFDQNNGFSVGGGVFGSNGDVLGGLTAVADLTGDGFPEIISGHQAWTVSWNAAPPAPPVVQLSLLWEHSGPDGYPAVADLDGDGAPEVVLVGDPAPFMDPDGAGPLQRDGQLQVLDGLTGQLWCGVDPTDAVCQANAANRTQPLPLRPAPGIVGGGRGGPPVVADFDGDGRQEIAVAGSTAYTVYDLNRPGEVVVQPAGDPPPALGALYTRWTSTTQDTSRGTTGSSAYDFQGDGIAE